MPRAITALLLLLTTALGSPAALAAPSPAACSFTLGFKALHDAIPNAVGDCIEDAIPQSDGDVIQPTKNGLLTWRHAYNRNIFSNGLTRWSDGPDGVQSRPSDYRFTWEPAPPAAPEYASLRDLSPHALVPPDGLKPFSAFTVGSMSGDEHSYSIGFNGPDVWSGGGLNGGDAPEAGSVFDFYGASSCDNDTVYCAIPPSDTRDGMFEDFRGVYVGDNPAIVIHTGCCAAEKWFIRWTDATSGFRYGMSFYSADPDDYKGLSPTNVRYAQSLAMLAEQLVPVT